jgi:outer membrane lipoprotein-sorting protein
MRWIWVAALAVCVDAGAAVGGSAPVPELTAEQIVEKNVAARGGLEAWRKIQTMVWIGHMESEHAPAPGMQFTLEQKRPNKTRFELRGPGEKNVRMFDGTQGWKLGPAHEGQPGVRPYTPQELKFAQDTQGIDGPLIDYQAKGNTVTLEGTEQIEGQKAYRLNVRLASGESHHVWIDAQNFLDIKVDRRIESPSGTVGTVAVFYRHFKTVEGLQIPSVIETGVGSGRQPDRMVIERVALNARLNDREFTHSDERVRRQGIATGVRTRPPLGQAPMEPSTLTAAPGPDPVSGQK